MRYSVALSLAISLAASSAFAEAPASRNPFVPAGAASAGKDTPKEAPKRESSGASTPRMPSTSPGTYRSPAPFIPPPPVGLGLPTLQLPPLDTSVPPPAGAAGPKEAASQPVAKEERKSDVFMTREQLQAQRAKCSVSLKSSNEVLVPEQGGRQVLKLALVGGRQCVKGVAASDDWVDVSSVSETGELVLVVQENEGSDERVTEVNIANTGTSLTIRVRQAASKEEFRQLKL